MTDSHNPTLDEILEPLRWCFARDDHGLYSLDKSAHSLEVKEAKAALTALILEARIEEVNSFPVWETFNNQLYYRDTRLADLQKEKERKL